MISYWPGPQCSLTGPQLHKAMFTLNEGRGVVFAETLGEGGLLQFWEHDYKNINITYCRPNFKKISKHNTFQFFT